MQGMEGTLSEVDVSQGSDDTPLKEGTPPTGSGEGRGAVLGALGPASRTAAVLLALPASSEWGRQRSKRVIGRARSSRLELRQSFDKMSGGRVVETARCKTRPSLPRTSGWKYRTTRGGPGGGAGSKSVQRRTSDSAARGRTGKGSSPSAGRMRSVPVGAASGGGRGPEGLPSKSGGGEGGERSSYPPSGRIPRRERRSAS